MLLRSYRHTYLLAYDAFARCLKKKKKKGTTFTDYVALIKSRALPLTLFRLSSHVTYFIE